MNTAPSSPLEKLDPMMTTLLGVVTCGIYPMVKFFQVAKAYQRRAPGPMASFDTLFWTYIGLMAVGLLTTGIFVGFALIVGSIVVSTMALKQVLASRAELTRTIYPLPKLHSDESHVALWAVSNALSFVFVGLVTSFVQCLWFFSDHNALAEADAAPAAAIPTGNVGTPIA